MYDEVMSIAKLRDQVHQGELTMERASEVMLDSDELLVNVDDPDSDEYAEAVLRIWSELTGRDSYDADIDELFDLDIDHHFRAPYPYTSLDPQAVSVYMGAVAHAIRLIGAKPPARVVEMGTGWGHLATMIASTGFRTTAVDLNPQSLALLRMRAEVFGLDLEVVQSNFLSYKSPDPVDCFVFYEAFHHCASPVKMIDNCVDMLSDGGRLLFVAEPFYEWYHQPWGIRPDGHAAIMMAGQGWLELGYSWDYMLELFLSRGLRCERTSVESLGPAAGLFVTATKRTGPIDLAEENLPSGHRSTWASAPAWSGPGAFACPDGSMFVLPDSASTVTLSLRNLGTSEVHVESVAGSQSAVIDVIAGGTQDLVVAVGDGRQHLRVSSSTAPADTIGMPNGIGALVESLTVS